MPPHAPPHAPGAPASEPPQAKPKLKKLRLLVVLAGLGLLALVSTVFGMMMAVASDLPALENRSEYKHAENSEVFADQPSNERIATLTGNQNRILLKNEQISPYIKNAVIAIEDQRFYEHSGVDYRGIGRALWQDIKRGSAVQGGSTITQQFVKNAVEAQGDRSVFQKLREAALAYHLEREWDKNKILTQYLNSVYFGNGAYGVESAVRTYFGDEADATLDPAIAAGEEPETDDPKALDVEPAEAALLAGIIASPSMYDPIENPDKAEDRRNQVLKHMLDQGNLSRAAYDEAIAEPLPTEDDIHPPQPESTEPYFTTWLTQQLVDRFGAGRVFSGGLKIKTTLDPELQAAAESAIAGRLAGIGPSASLVAIENRTGEVKAMVGGADYAERPFNLATNGHRQPGSSFKPFILIRALQDGVSPDQTYESRQKIFTVPNSGGKEKFVANNYENSYSGIASLRSATARSDNSVFAELGIKTGTRRVARLAQRMGIRTPVSTNLAMTLGGLTQGVTPLEMAYAYSTLANKGQRVSGSLASAKDGPVAIEKVERGDDVIATNKKKTERVFPEAVGETAHELLAGVVLGGTGKNAQIGEFAAGKTGTTENYGDAWFVGFNNELTVAVWVGYADKVQPMETEYAGSPVAGGTYPTSIWHDFMTAWINIREQRDLLDGTDDDEGETATPLPGESVIPTEPSGPSTTPDAGTEAAPGGEQTPDQPAPRDAPDPAPPAPTPQPPATPAPAPAPTPSPGGGAGPGGGAAPG